MPQRRLRIQDYTVGWVCALPIELAAATMMLDEEHLALPQDSSDANIYTLGSIGQNGIVHNVVLACLPAGQIGAGSAATVAIQMQMTFDSIRFGLMVGIGGGVPSTESDIRLGDVVVSQPHMQHGGVVQYDFGKAGPSGFVRTGSLNTPPTILLTALAKVKANYYLGRKSLSAHLSRITCLPHFSRACAGADILFKATYSHVEGPTCEKCDRGQLVVGRTTRNDGEILVHHGTIASGNQVIKNGVTRDKLSAELGGVLCFEMEAAGLMNGFPCIVIRGICDYADSHKNKKWQPYAAATAAAYAKELLSFIPPVEVVETSTVGEAIGGSETHDSACILPIRRKSTATITADNTKGIRSTILNNISHQLAPVDFQPALASMEDSRCPGSGLWLRGDRTVIDWLSSGPAACLLLSGGPGSGKTHLMAGMISFLRELHLEDSGVAVTYFLFDGKSEDSSKRLSLAALQTLTAQVFEEAAKLDSKSVEAKLEAIAHSQRKAKFVPRNQLSTMLREAMKGLSMTYLILDALDECEDLSEMLRVIQQLLTEGNISLKLLLSSQNTRHIPELVAKLPSRVQFRLILDAQTMRHDITQLVKYRTENMDIDDVGSPEETCKILVDGSQGLILLAKLRLDELEQQLPSTNIGMEATLQQLPIGVHQYYERALARLGTEDRLLAKDMFIWVLHAQASLSMEELIEASSLLFEGPEIMGSTKLSRLGVRRLGAGLVEEIDNHVKLFHGSVREFAVGYDWGGEKPSKIPSQDNVHSRMTAFLLKYMSKPELVSDILSTSGLVLERSKRWPLLDYAVTYWLAHLRLSSKDDLGLICQVEDFLGSDKGLAWWVQFTVGVDSYNWWLLPQLSSEFFALFHRKAPASPDSPSSIDVVARLCKGHVALLTNASSEQQLTVYINALNRLASKESECGRLEQAERLLRRAIQASKELPLGLNTPAAMASLTTLCGINLAWGHFSEAISLCNRMSSLIDLSNSKHNRYFVEIQMVRGSIESSLCRSKASEDIFRNARYHAKRTLGGQDPCTLAVTNDLALICIKLGKYSEAEELLNIPYYEAVLGREHPSTLTGAGNLADVFQRAGKFREAEQRYLRIYDRRLRIQGPNAEDTLRTGNRLVDIYREKGRLTAAADLLRNLWVQHLAREDSTNPLTQDLQMSLAWVKFEGGKQQEADELLTGVYETRSHHLGLKHPWTVDIMESLSFLKRARGHLAEAERLQVIVLRFREEEGEEGDPQLLNAMDNLARIRQEQGKLMEAERLRERSLSGWKEIADDENPLVLASISNLSATKYKLGKLEEAERLQGRVLEYYRKIQDSESPGLLRAMSDLATTKMSLGKPLEAEHLEEQVLEARKKIGDNEGSRVLTAMANLAITKRVLGKLELAEQLEEGVLRLRRKIGNDEGPDVLTAMANLAITKRVLGKLEVAEQLEEGVLKLRKKIGDDEGPGVLTAMGNLAITKGALGKLGVAERLEEDVLKLRRKIGDDEGPDALTAMANLAITKRSLGKLIIAEQIEGRVLEVRKKTGDEEGPGVLEAMTNLAITKRMLGKLDVAEEMEEQVLEVRKKIGDEEGPGVLKATADLAATKRMLGKLDVAEQMEERVLEACKKIGNAEGPRVLTAMANLAATKRELNQLEAAEQLQQQVLDISKRTSDGEGPTVLSAMINLAVAKSDLGKFEEAEMLGERVLELRKRIGQAEGPAVLEATRNLAVTKSYRGKFSEALEMQSWVLGVSTQLLGDDHLHTLNEMSYLALVYQTAGRYSEAEELRLKVLETSERKLGREHPIVMEAKSSLALLYDTQARGEDANRLYRQVLECYERTLGPHHPYTIAAMDGVAITDTDDAASTEAKNMMSHVVQWRTQNLGPENPCTLGSKHRLAMILMGRREFREAQELQLKVIECRERVLGSDHLDTLKTKEMLALCHLFQGNSETGSALAREVLEGMERILGPDHPDLEGVRGLV